MIDLCTRKKGNNDKIHNDQEINADENLLFEKENDNHTDRQIDRQHDKRQPDRLTDR